MLLVYLVEIIITIIIAALWTRGIDKMKNEHPDYKGEDFLNWDDDKTNTETEL